LRRLGYKLPNEKLNTAAIGAGVKLGDGNHGLDGRMKDYRFPSQLLTRSA
jgi:hypothetical protein